MSNRIIRAPRRHRFLIVDQRAVDDERLSWAARGMLVYLLARPDNWRVLVRDLQRRGDLGRDGVYKVLRELRDVGYVLYQRKRDNDGRLRGGDYYVTERPFSPHPCSPDTAPPYPVNTDALPNTESKVRTTTTTKPTKTKHTKNQSRQTIDFATWVPHNLRGPAESIVSKQAPDLAQLIVDEWAGNMAAGSIQRCPLRYLQALVRRMNMGELIPRYAPDVARARAGQTVDL